MSRNRSFARRVHSGAAIETVGPLYRARDTSAADHFPLRSEAPLTLGWCDGYPTVGLFDTRAIFINTPVANRLNVLWELWCEVENNGDSTDILRLVRELSS